jgi:hypothetical protein
VTEQQDATALRILGYVVPALGILLLVAILPFYLASGLSAPLWAILMLLLIWGVLFTLAIKWFRPRPFVVLILPFVAAAIWFAVMTAGEAFLGWTA